MLDGLFINTSSVTGTPIRLSNNQFLRSQNALGTGDVNILKVNGSNQIELSSVPIVTGLGSLALLSDITNYGPQIAALQSDVLALQSDVNNLNVRVTALESSVAILQADVGTLQSQVILLSLSVATIQTDISALQALQANYLLLDGTRAMTGNLNMASNKIVNLIAPTSPGDAANKAYVDSLVTDITDLENRVTALELSVVDIETELADINSEVAILQSDVNILNTSVNSLQIDVDALETLQSSYLLLNGTRAMTGALNMSTNKIVNLGNPTAAQDAATKAYVDSIATDITDLENRVTALEADVVTINGEILTIQTTLSALDSQVQVMQIDVDALEALQGSYLLIDGTRSMTGNLIFNTSGFAQILTSGSSGSSQGVALKSGDASSGNSGIVAVGSGDALSGVAGDLFLFSGIGASGRGMVQVEATKLNVLGFVDMNLSKIVNLQDPTAPQDAATKAYADSIATDITDLENRVTALETDVATIEGQILSLQTDVSTLQSEVASLQSEMITAQNDIDALELLQDDYLLLNGTRTMTGSLNMGTNKITSLGNPTLAQDAATKFYVDSLVPAPITASNLGSGEGVFAQKVSADLQFKSLVAGTNISFSSDADSITVNSTGGGISSININKDGTLVLATTTLNFIGAGVTVADNGGVADITITGGGTPGAFDYIEFNLTPTGVPLTTGVLYWDEADSHQTLSLNMEGGSVVQQIGQQFFIRVKASAAITKGQVVMVTGTVGTSGTYLAQPAAGVTDGHVIIGVAAENIAINDFGYVTEMGDVRGFVTDGSTYGETWNDGDDLYWNPNPLYPGGMTNVKPLAPSVKAYIGTVLKASNGMSGSIYVRLNPGSILGETDSNVQFGTLNTNDFITYNSGLGYWTNVDVAEVKTTLGIKDIAVSDEGSSITTSVSSFNFTGAGVTASSDVNGNVTVNIPGGGGGATKFVRGFAFAGSFTAGAESIPLVITSASTIQKIKIYGTNIVGGWVFELFKNGVSFFTGLISSSAVASNIVSVAVAENDVLTAQIVAAGSMGDNFTVTMELG